MKPKLLREWLLRLHSVLRAQDTRAILASQKEVEGPRPAGFAAELHQPELYLYEHKVEEYVEKVARVLNNQAEPSLGLWLGLSLSNHLLFGVLVRLSLQSSVF
jgi:hypothetical protein